MQFLKTAAQFRNSNVATLEVRHLQIGESAQPQYERSPTGGDAVPSHLDRQSAPAGDQPKTGHSRVRPPAGPRGQRAVGVGADEVYDFHDFRGARIGRCRILQALLKRALFGKQHPIRRANSVDGLARKSAALEPHQIQALEMGMVAPDIPEGDVVNSPPPCRQRRRAGQCACAGEPPKARP